MFLATAAHIPQDVARFAPLLHLALVLALYVPGRPILAHDKPALRAGVVPVIAFFSPAPHALCVLPYQLGEVTGGVAETGRAIEIVLAALVAPGFDGGSGVEKALGQVLSVGSMLKRSQ